ncbi:MAG: carboxypeptidase regulatory-like domain-containing protein [Acidobacteriota bacterium]|nr:carboxypeptidase regulatory-like domain-containing protein [Acidobacteriota bacterium]
MTTSSTFDTLHSRTPNDAPAGDVDDHRRSQKAEDKTGAAFSCFGRVLHQGKAVAGAEVTLFHHDGAYRPSVVSDAQGNFRFDGLKAGSYSIQALARDLCSDSLETKGFTILLNEETPSVGPLIINLIEAGELLLNVIARETGEPIPGASVRRAYLGGELGKTDENGQLSLFLAPEIHPLQITAPGFAMTQKVLDITSHQRTSYTVSLAPGGSVGGKVLDGNLQPIAGARVQLHTRRLHPVFTDSSGDYRFESLPLEERRIIQASAPGYKTSSVSVTLSETERAIVKNLVLRPQDPEPALPGLVTDRKGVPIADAAVGFGDQSPHTRTRTDGSFETTVPHDTLTRRLYVFKQGFARYVRFIHQRDFIDGKPLKIVLSRSYTLEGRVVDIEGVPISGVSIDARSKTLDAEADFFRPAGVTDSGGTFRLTDIPRDVDLRFHRYGYSSKTLNGLIAENSEPLEVELASDLKIAGRVVDARTGKAIPAFKVRVTSPDGSRSVQGDLKESEGVDFNNPEGRFVLGNQSAEKRFLIITTPGGEVGFFDNILPEEEPEEQTFPLGSGPVTIAGTVLDDKGKPIADTMVAVWLYRPGDPISRSTPATNRGNLTTILNRALLGRSTATDANGRFRFEDLPNGAQADLLFVHNDFSFKQLREVMEKPPEELADLQVRLRRKAGITVRVNPSRYPRGSVELRRGPYKQIDFHALEKSHEREFVNLEPTEYVVSLQVDSLTAASKTIDLAEGEHRTLQFGFGEQSTLGGKAYHGNRPASGHQLILISKEPEKMTEFNRIVQTTGNDGSFRFGNLESGSYTLVLGGRNETDIGFFVDQHPNRLDLDVSSDIEESFTFNRYGALTGRVTRDGYRYLILQKTADGVFYRRTLPLTGKSFRIESIPPGIYNLSGAYEDLQTDRLASGFTIPENGADLDLGDLGHDAAGSVMVRFSSQPDGCFARFSLVRTDIAEEVKIHRNLRIEGLSVLLNDIPVGSWFVQAAVSWCGYNGFVENPGIQVREEETAELFMELEPVTELTLLLNRSNRNFKTIRVENGFQTIQFQGGSFSEGAEYEQRQGSYFSEKVATARGLPEGSWLVIATDDKDETYKVEVTLKKGEHVSQRL